MRMLSEKRLEEDVGGRRFGIYDLKILRVVINESTSEDSKDLRGWYI